MKIIVTGGAGFIGSHVARAALEAGHSVAVLDDLSTGKRERVPEGAAFHEVDIRDSAAVDAAFAQFKPDAVCHQAAQASVVASVRDPALDASINVLGSVHVFQAAQRCGARVVYASTGGALYGEVPEGERATTAVWPKPVSPYACSKLSAEYYLLAAGASGLPVCVLRYANVYGPGQDPHGEAGVVAIFARRLLAREPITIFARRTAGDDGGVRDYVCVTDVVRANLLALEGKLDGRTMNVGTGIGTTTRELANRMMGLLDRRGVATIPAPRRPGDLERSILDPTEMENLLGPARTLESGLEETVRWFADSARLY